VDFLQLADLITAKSVPTAYFSLQVAGEGTSGVHSTLCDPVTAIILPVLCINERGCIEIFPAKELSMSCMVGIVPLWRTFSRCFLSVDVNKQGHKYGTLIVGIKIKPKIYLRLQRMMESVSLFSQAIDWFSGAIMHYPNRAHRTG
jgi:hypothetical protein